MEEKERADATVPPYHNQRLFQREDRTAFETWAEILSFMFFQYLCKKVFF